jgi:hypothetical protein
MIASRCRHCRNVAKVVVQLGLLHIGALAADEKRHRVEPEAGDPELQPEAHDLRDLVPDCRVPGVQIGLMFVEAVEVVLLRLLVPGPRRLLHTGKHHPLVVIRRPLLRPDIPVAERRVGVGAGVLKPRVIDGRVIGHEVDDDADAERLRVVREGDEVAERAVLVRHAVVVAHVVAVVPVRRLGEGQQPDAGDAEAREIRQAGAQAFEIADAVTGSVHVLLDVQAIDDRVPVPKVFEAHVVRPRKPRSRTRAGAVTSYILRDKIYGYTIRADAEGS